MQTIVKKFDELTNKELYEILQMRSKIFVVEQNCPYLDADGVDLNSYHVMLKDGEELVAYLRVIEKGARLEEVSIGRVITLKTRRREGLGSIIMREGLKVAKEKFGAKKIKIGAQVQAQPFYESLGFRVCSEHYMEDGIPHVYMVAKLV